MASICKPSVQWKPLAKRARNFDQNNLSKNIEPEKEDNAGNDKHTLEFPVADKADEMSVENDTVVHVRVKKGNSYHLAIYL